MKVMIDIPPRTVAGMKKFHELKTGSTDAATVMESLRHQLFYNADANYRGWARNGFEQVIMQEYAKGEEKKQPIIDEAAKILTVIGAEKVKVEIVEDLIPAPPAPVEPDPEPEPIPDSESDLKPVDLDEPEEEE